MTHPDQGRLNDYVDGDLPASAAAGLEEHLAECDACRGRTEALRELSDRLGTLPRGIAPRRELRPAVPAPPTGPGPSRAGRWLRTAAGVAVLIGAGAGVWFGLVPHDGAPRDSPAVAPADPVVGAYARAADELATTVRARRAELSPEAVRALDANLAAVDAAIRELERARAAAESGEAGADPVADPAILDRYLEARYRTRLELLRGALHLLEAS